MTREPKETWPEAARKAANRIPDAFIEAVRGQAMSRERSDLCDLYCSTDSRDCMGAEFRAEIERQQTDINKLMSERDGWLQEIEQLRADIASLRGLNNQLLVDCAKAEAEIERLKADATKWQEVASQGVTTEHTLRVEIERLKEIEIKYDQLISGAFI